MGLVTCLVVTAVVWSVSMLRSLRLRALVYSLPIPITVVLLTTTVSVDGSQLAGVALLVVFFAVVSWLHHRIRMPILVADAGGVVAYVGLAVGVAAISRLPFLPTLLLVLGAWAAVNVAIRIWQNRHRPASAAPSGEARNTDGYGPVRKLLVVFVGSLVAVGVGGPLSGLVVTFPYSGVLVAIESRKSLPAFTRLFAFNSLGLVAFMSGYYALSANGEAVALLVAWGAFGATAMLLHGTDVRRVVSRVIGKLRDSRPVACLHKRWARLHRGRQPRRHVAGDS